MNNKIIYLTGFMGSGKSTIGPILANVLGWDFSDLDKLIEEEEGETVSTIFETKGEQYFRQKESELLLKLTSSETLVLALGGGTLSTNENHELIKKNGISIYLKSSPDEIFRRLKFKTDRPLLKSAGGLPLTANESITKISELLAKRETTYMQADIIFPIDNITVGKTVDELVRLLKRKYDL